MADKGGDWRGRVVECGIDWITCTAKAGTLQAQVLKDLALTILDGEERYGFDVKAIAMEGYRGTGCGGVAFGARKEDVLVRLSGHTAAEWWQEITPMADNISRADIQVTAALEKPDHEVHQKHRREHAKRALRGRGKPPQIGIAEGETWVRKVSRGTATNERRPTGGTLYIGSRKSDVFMRAYDKGAERLARRAPPPDGQRRTTWEPGVWWRYEVELKRKVARDTIARLVAAPVPERTAMVRAMTHGEWTRKGVQPRFAAKGDGAEIVRASRPRSDSERRLDYLETVVGPMLRGLMDAGLYDEALARLERGTEKKEGSPTARTRAYAQMRRAGGAVPWPDVVGADLANLNPAEAAARAYLAGKWDTYRVPDAEMFHVEQSNDPAQLDALEPGNVDLFEGE